MNTSVFRVAYIDPPMYPSFVEVLEANTGIELTCLLPDDTPERIAAVLARCHGYYVKASRDELPRHLHVTDALLERMPELLVAASYGAGYDTIDVTACTARGVVVANQAGGNAQAVAEHAIGAMMTLLKRIPECHQAVLAGAVGAREALMGRELAGKTVGIIGLGHVGTRTAALLKVFGGRTLAFDPYVDAATCEQRGAEKAGLDELVAASDVVTVHCPLTPETRGLFDAAKFNAMKRGAIFVNTARGSTYDEAALHAALVSGHLGGAGLDVWETEPPSIAHPLLQLPTVIASPHTGGVTHESRDRVARYAAEAFMDAAEGRLPSRTVNPEAGKRARARLAAAGFHV